MHLLTSCGHASLQHPWACPPTGVGRRAVSIWRRGVLVALTALTLGALGAASADAAQAPRPDIAGDLVRSSTADPRVYMIDPEGYRRHIPDAMTYVNLFLEPMDSVVRTEPNTFSIAEKPAISSGAVLVTAKNRPVCLVSNGVQRCIVSAAVFNRFRFNWNKIKWLDPIVFDTLGRGPNWYANL